ncbi:MAG: signal recognition particle protein [Candidatus Marinimicrobia bacterium]|nr:signal recognition particle protein [Candidatus Neomarinimicrobiota bacterium]MCF7829612.1 signal recognition particle protein [Candidatus Neomarinimicrobiota bacterium]MCF7879772.1 signal recognition particle protein [Candidatus Neomarinimicrobiota bacterium]
MFERLSENLDSVLKKLRGRGKLSEKNISDGLREVRRALLEADVNYKVAKNFIASVKEKAVGKEVLESITPGQQIVKIIHDELVELLGAERSKLELTGKPPHVIMVVGLQGSGKTTFVTKLGKHLHDKGYSPLLVGADVYRPAAKDQLQTNAEKAGLPAFVTDHDRVLDICTEARQHARKHHEDVLILDTAGRLHIDASMMDELSDIRSQLRPDEILFVADGMTGQDAVNAASEFLNHLDFTGVVLTKMDGDARGGAALSIRSVTERPIKFMSVGETVDSLEPFHPDRLANRILGMGDVVSLVEKAEETIDEESAKELNEKIKRNEFSLADFQEQLQQIKNMGPLDQLLDMIPGMGKIKQQGLSVDGAELDKIEAMISSMTPEERQKPGIINGSRRKRIARGSGTSVGEVNQLLKQFQQMKKMMQQMNQGKLKRQMTSLPF